MQTDLLVIGAGLTGATIARLAIDAGISVSVIEKNNAPGGNLRDFREPQSGWLIHGHGPHFFRTSSLVIWTFVSRFANWRSFEATVSSKVNSRLIPWPLNQDFLDREYGPAKRCFEHPANFRESCLNRMPEAAYRDMIEPYVLKQWGVAPEILSADLGRRIEIRANANDHRLKTSPFQAIPNGGYGTFLLRMLKDIPIRLNMNPHSRQRGRKLTIHTGAIDHFFGYRLGRLRYRSQAREHLWFSGARHYTTTCMVYPQVADGPQVRDTEWGSTLPFSIIPHTGTLITRETPQDPTSDDDLEYPFPSIEDRTLYERYLTLAAKTHPNMIFAGRLGTFQYLDMDQAIGHAFAIFEKQIKPRLAESDAPNTLRYIRAMPHAKAASIPAFPE